jgi:hypothetical protein
MKTSHLCINYACFWRGEDIVVSAYCSGIIVVPFVKMQNAVFCVTWILFLRVCRFELRSWITPFDYRADPDLFTVSFQVLEPGSCRCWRLCYSSSRCCFCAGGAVPVDLVDMDVCRLQAEVDIGAEWGGELYANDSGWIEARNEGPWSGSMLSVSTFGGLPRRFFPLELL